MVSLKLFGFYFWVHLAFLVSLVVLSAAQFEKSRGFSALDLLKLTQQACSVYIFNFEVEFPSLGGLLAPNATRHECDLTGLASTGGPLFKRTTLRNDDRASVHAARGVLPARFSQHSGPWWIRNALATSPNLVHDIRDADIIFVDDFCYAAWSEAKTHDHRTWGLNEEMYVDPDIYLAASYQLLLKHPAFKKKSGANFVFFHSHPALFLHHAVLCKPAFAAALHLVPEAQVRHNCGLPSSPGHHRMLVVPYASFPLYHIPMPAVAATAATAAAAAAELAPLARPRLLYFRASCGGRSVGKALRRAVAEALRDVAIATDGGAAGALAFNASIVSCESYGWEDSSLREMAESRYCLVLPGDTASSRRLSEAVLMGCVPVFVGPPFAATPLSNVVRYDTFALVFEVQAEAVTWLSPGNQKRRQLQWQLQQQLQPVEGEQQLSGGVEDGELEPGGGGSGGAVATATHWSTTRLAALRDLPAALQAVGRRQYEALLYHLATIRPAFSYVSDPDRGPLADLSDVLYSRMCFQSEAAAES
ncbi:hypothetical protein Vafri_6382 [Volvox africanus]|uniref:Exostosin GT47 domain-containing protein n=1 Tax=Volvox africanus TaxID=51714 RepID=A0A8J4EXZ5_9CHLO|nr:hypothetical protein Vafri_6382 [Volvox africanus]